MSHGNGNIQALTRPFVDRAYALAREVDHGLTLDNWRTFARDRIAAATDDCRLPGALVAVRGSLIRGLAAYDLDRSIGRERILKVTNVVTMDRTREQGCVSELLAGLLTVAESAGCDRILVELSDVSRWIAPRWSDPDGNLFRLPIRCVHMPGTARPPETEGRVVSLRQPA